MQVSEGLEERESDEEGLPETLEFMFLAIINRRLKHLHGGLPRN